MLIFWAMKNIWQKVIKNKPFFCLAPMADVTDIAFRQIIARYSKHGKVGGGLDLFWTEFVSADGLASTEGRKKLIKDLKFSKKEKPIIAQIFGAKPETIKKTCQIISKLGFDGIDINMGCPDKAVVKQGSGSALIRTPDLAREIIKAAKEGASKIPISVKTRIGFNKIEYKEWLSEILKEKPVALTIHFRTKKEMSKVDAHWELAKEISDFVRSIDKEVILIANGDIKDLKEGKEKAIKNNYDGVMIGRGIFGNPWLFDSTLKKEISIKEKLKVLVEHTKLFNKLLSKQKRFDVMKKHYKAYANGFDGAKELRIKLMETKTIKEVEKVINNFIVEHKLK
jgi:nifR3 family TIM-barrel protein